MHHKRDRRTEQDLLKDRRPLISPPGKIVADMTNPIPSRQVPHDFLLLDARLGRVQAAAGVIADLMNESMDDPLLHSRPESDATASESMDWLSYFRPEPDAAVVEFVDHVSGDAAEQKRILVAQAGSEGSTIEPIALEALREEIKKAQLTIKDSLAAASALRSEMNSLSALATEIGAEYSRVQETARAVLERGATVEQRLGAIESRLGALGDLDDVRREIEQRGVQLGSEMARSQSVQAFTEPAWHRAWELVGRLKTGAAADAFRSAGAASRAQRSLTVRNVAWCVQRGRMALRANVRRCSLGLCGARNAAWSVERKLPVALGNLRRRLLSMHVAEAMANLPVPKTIVLIKYVAVAVVFTVLALTSAFVLHFVGRTADLAGPPVITPMARVPSTAVPDLPSNTSATTSSEGSLDSAPTMQSLASTRQAASVDFETPATRRTTEFGGTLSIRSTPDKAQVRIDRERAGETPLVLRRLRAGSHAIWIEHEGYQRWTAGVNVPAYEVTQVTVTLKAEPASTGRLP